ncbi:MAG: hypothetical protein L0H84_18165 [Pseudonocardia sp.]|nr:hypothetical protein [Pseudonocardia sp.]
MGDDVTTDDPETSTGPQEVVAPEPAAPDRAEPSRARTALISAVVSAIVTGALAALLAYPVACDRRLAPFMSDCVNVAGWSAFADYPSTAMVISLIAAAAAGVLIYLMVRFSDS